MEYPCQKRAVTEACHEQHADNFQDVEMPRESTNNAATGSLIQVSSPAFALNFPPPTHLQLKGYLVENWKKWKQVWDAYETVTTLAQKVSKFCVATFITCIGPEALEIHNGLLFRTDFSSLKDEMICDRLVCGITEKNTRRKLLQEMKLSLERCLDICRSSLVTNVQHKGIIGETTVHAPQQLRQKMT